MPYYNNPYYNNQFYQQQNYQQQPQQIQFQPSGICGRVVNDFNEVTANDVPMNGNVAYFPKADLSEIEARQWNANGTISRLVFKPLNAQQGNVQMPDQNTEFESLKRKLDDVLDKVNQLLKGGVEHEHD